MRKETPKPSKQQVPDPAHTYERTDPTRESGAGRLTNNAHATPAPGADKIASAVHNAQDGAKQLNGDESAADAARSETSGVENESLGWEKKAKK
jgi:hypothetical protein